MSRHSLNARFFCVTGRIILALGAGILFSCASTPAPSGDSPAKKSSPSYEVALNDNCPQNTYALTAELALEATISGYKGTTSLLFSVPPEDEQVRAAQEFHSFCRSIAEAIEKGTGRTVSLSFNTSPDSSGEEFKFSNAKEIKASLQAMAQGNITELYAVYDY